MTPKEIYIYGTLFSVIFRCAEALDVDLRLDHKKKDNVHLKTNLRRAQNILPSNVVSLGCFSDNIPRDLPYYQGGKTLQDCSLFCDEKGYLYFGRQWDNECWCGNTYGAYEPSSSCHDCLDFDSGINVGSGVNCVYQITESQFLPSNVSFKGCYIDGSPRVLPDHKGEFSLEDCMNECDGYKYAGRQYIQECWCGDNDNYDTYGSSDGCVDCHDSTPGHNIGGSLNCVYALEQAGTTASPSFPPSGSLPPSLSPSSPQTTSPSVSLPPTPSPTSQQTASPSLPPTVSLPPSPSPSSPPTASPSLPPSVSPSASLAPSPSPAQQTATYQGCFQDASWYRDLPVFVGSKTFDACAIECASRGFEYMGRQWIQECWCGQSFGYHGTSNSCTGCANSAPNHNIGAVNCVYQLVVNPAPQVTTPIKALIIRPHTFTWNTYVDNYVHWITDRIIALKKLGILEGVSVQMRHADNSDSRFFYQSSVANTGYYTDGGWNEEMMYAFLESMRNHSIKTYAWVPALYDPYLIAQNASFASYDRENNQVNATTSPSTNFATVFNSEVRSHVYSIIQEVLTKSDLNRGGNFDGLRLDYIRFEGDEYDFSDYALNGYLGQNPNKPNPLGLEHNSLNDPDWLLWLEYKNTTITEFLKEAATTARNIQGQSFDVGGYLLPFAAQDCLIWNGQGNCFEYYNSFNFRMLPMVYYQTWSSYSSYESWLTTMISSCVSHGTCTPTGSVTSDGFEDLSGSSSQQGLLETFTRFVEISAAENADGIDIFLYPKYLDEHFNRIEAALQP